MSGVDWPKESGEYPFLRYLLAKRTVDDRALHPRVWATFCDLLRSCRTEAPDLLELGAGAGTMLLRLLEHDLIANINYTAVDQDSEILAFARRQMPTWASRLGYQLMDENSEYQGFQRGVGRLEVSWVVEEVSRFLSLSVSQGRWHGLLAHAFLDLVNLQTLVPLGLGALQPGGFFYFSLNFDGLTAFEPLLDSELDARILDLYHRTMDERLVDGQPSGDSQTGRMLFPMLRVAGAEILDAGSSDWVVWAGADGYPADEAYFLRYILQTVKSALQGNPQLGPGELESWINARTGQVARGELVFIAHQVDLLGRI